MGPGAPGLPVPRMRPRLQFPDARLGSDGRDGRPLPSRTSRSSRRTTAALTRRPRSGSGFTRYRASGARLGGLRTTGTKRSWRGPTPRRGAVVRDPLRSALHAIAEKGLHRASGRLPGDRHVALPASASVAGPASTLGLPTARRTTIFFASLVAKKRATSYAAAHRRAHHLPRAQQVPLRRD